MNRILMILMLAIMTLPQIAFGQDSAQTNLVWQLPVGRKIDVVMKQNMDMNQQVGGQELATEMVSTNYMLWEIAEVNDAGIATVNSEIGRMTISVDGPQGKFEIDTDSEEELDGIAAGVADQIKKLIGEQFSQTMNAQGKILSVTMPDEFESGNPMMTKESLSQLIKNASPVFPDKPVAVGETWNQKSETPMPGGMGGMKIDSTYTYKGTEDVDGKTLDVVEIAMEMQFVAEEGSPIEIEITEQDTKGKMLFNSVKGHTQQINIDQKMTMKVTVGPQTIDQTMHSRTDASFSLKE